MALHIADSEVSNLATELAKLEHTSKTEALRRVLREAVAHRNRRSRADGFEQVARRIAADARQNAVLPVTKEEMDQLWGMDQIDGN